MPITGTKRLRASKSASKGRSPVTHRHGGAMGHCRASVLTGTTRAQTTGVSPTYEHQYATVARETPLCEWDGTTPHGTVYYLNNTRHEHEYRVRAESDEC